MATAAAQFIVIFLFGLKETFSESRLVAHKESNTRETSTIAHHRTWAVNFFPAQRCRTFSRLQLALPLCYDRHRNHPSAQRIPNADGLTPEYPRVLLQQS
ncbi:hypothetical protein BJV82DRAFT_601291 [Fennellomyces sp. T-0311]|nr:hypothetical protein BJV82DRAFT_601291 [Fennellomyces sp. T-0311]